MQEQSGQSDRPRGAGIALPIAARLSRLRVSRYAPGSRLPHWLPLLLGFLTAVGPVSTDIYLPAFPAMEASFGAPAGSAQITLATWFAGLAVGQLTQGTLADRFGRRGPLIIGAAIFTLAAAGCALSPSFAVMSVFRFIAAFGGSACMVIPRAVVRDLADGHAAARMLAQLMLVMGVAPILAPTLGGLVLAVASWRVIFWFSTGFGIACLCFAALLLPDTLPPERRIPLHPRAMAARYLAILRERSFLSHASMLGCTAFAVFAYLGGSPVVFIELHHLSPAQYGMLFGGNALCFIGATQLNARLLPRYGSDRVLRIGSGGYLLGSLLLTLASVTGWGGVGSLIAALAFCQFSVGFINPTATVGALSHHAAQAGSASAVMGTLQFLFGAVSGVLIGALTDGTARPMALLLLLGAVGAKLADRARPRPHPAAG